MYTKAGLDISIDGTGIYISNNHFYFFHKTQKWPKMTKGEKWIHGNQSAGYNLKESKLTRNLQRYQKNAEMIMEIMMIHNVIEVAIEGYAYGFGKTDPGYVFDIGEFTGFVKSQLLQRGIYINVFQPGTVKKNFTGNGAASKVLMVEQFRKDYPNNVLLKWIQKNELEQKIYENPINDMIDAFALYKCLED